MRLGVRLGVQRGKMGRSRVGARARVQRLAHRLGESVTIQEHVDQVNRDLASEEMMAGSQIRRFLVLHKELDADDGELTRTQKVRRSFIAERYQPLIEALLPPAIGAAA